MEILDFFKVLALAFTILFPVVNPVGCAPIFLSMTRWYPRATQKAIAKKVAIYGFLILTVSLILGAAILDFFGISVPVIQMAGGLILTVTGWNLLNEKDDSGATQESSGSLDDAMAKAFFPLTLPITVGPGCISIAITLGVHLRSVSGPGFFGGVPRHFTAALCGMLLLCVLIYIFYGGADHLVRRLGKSGTNILVRMSAFILFAIGVQIFWNGLSAGLPLILQSVKAP